MKGARIDLRQITLEISSPKFNVVFDRDSVHNTLSSSHDKKM